MASKAEQWKRLHDLVLDPALVYVVTVNGRIWVTDRYVLVDLDAARQHLHPEPGTWRLRASAGPVPADASAGTLSPTAAERLLGKLSALDWQPADVTPWALADDDHGSTARLLVAGDEPVFMDDSTVRRWKSAFPETADTVIWHAARIGQDRQVARATLRHDYGAFAKCDPSETVFGYLMAARRLEPLPPFPKLVTP